MLKTLASRNPDLQALLDKGHALAIDNNCLVVRDLPYLDGAGELQWGALVCKLVFEDEFTVRAEDHQAMWAGPRPYGLDGQVVPGLGGGAVQFSLSDRCQDVVVQQGFSYKLKASGAMRDYRDHVEKIDTYVAAVCGPAMSKFGVDPYTYREYEEDETRSVFKLRDTLTSRANLSELARLFENDVIAVIGLGGTGAYVLDFIVKTPVREVRGFDPDQFFVHNAFRSPGRVDADSELRQPKAMVYQRRYEDFRHGLELKPLFVDGSIGNELDGVTFAFVCVDKGSSRRRIFDVLLAKDIPFIDVGMGLGRKHGPISGMLRTTHFPQGEGEAVREKCSAPQTDPPDDVYRTNIQIGELNALNAALAVLRFKQSRGFYAGPPACHELLFTMDNVSLQGSHEH